MGQIVNIKNFNLYCGRYSQKANPKTPEKEIGWHIEDNILEKLPVLALRNKSIGEKSSPPLLWKKDRNLFHAIGLTLETLKGWQAFRPEESNKIIDKLKNALPKIVLRFQEDMHSYEVETLRDIMKLEQGDYDEVLQIVAKAVGKISAFKNDSTPMLGSKIMHFLYPEFFPVWDTAWIKNVCLKNENESLEEWFSERVEKRLSDKQEAVAEYMHYCALMLKDLDETGPRECNKIARALIGYSKIPNEVIYWHFYDISTLIFEFCLLGKHY